MGVENLGIGRRKTLAIVGQGGVLSQALARTAEELGRRAVEAGFRVATGGLSGVMAAASRGAAEVPGRAGGDVIAILPGLDPKDANPFADIVITTGMGVARNIVLVASADVVIAVGGGSGTLSEIAIAWQLGRPLIALEGEGWSGRLAGDRIDDLRREPIAAARDPETAIALALRMVVEP